MITRREFIEGVAVVAGSLALRKQDPGSVPAVISTWSFGRRANGIAWEILSKGGTSLDAVEKGINDAELDPKNTSVGYGGLPNEEGEVTLDAVLMHGPRHAAGAVGCLKRIKTPISVARKVLEKTKHTFLVGEDATRFAVKMGFKEENLLTEDSKKAWETWKADPKRASFWTHDTIGMVAVDAKGDVTAGCSTSGLAWKIAGRVGDSPIVGSGAYCDNEVGGAAATGNGDVMMRFCPAIVAVEMMRAGKSPSEACAASLARIAAKGYKVGGALVALSRKGEFGFAQLNYPDFECAVRSGAVDELRSEKKR
ncbi:MAG TPA: N(4)-(beta-N-acetylglucosaminyl)-L-asparaginase [Planctomycetota bacterium]|nr:N(4)-(beta-N-acetylglucosaminyl)-L-asparaginase [Planctomycetota bacterium]